MEELAKRKDLIINNPDKAGTVMTMNTDSYIKEANRQLSDKASYKQLTQTQNYNITKRSAKQKKDLKTRNS